MIIALVCLLTGIVSTVSSGYVYSLSGDVPYNYQGEYAPAYDNYKPKDYKFEYGVSDPHTGDHKSQWEVKENGVVRGAYSLLEPDGTTRIVEYIADDDGFRAVVKKLGVGVHEQVSYGDLHALYDDHSGSYGGHYTNYLQGVQAVYPAPAVHAVAPAPQSFGPIIVPDPVAIKSEPLYSGEYSNGINAQFAHSAVHVQPQIAVNTAPLPLNVQPHVENVAIKSLQYAQYAPAPIPYVAQAQKEYFAPAQYAPQHIVSNEYVTPVKYSAAPEYNAPLQYAHQAQPIATYAEPLAKYVSQHEPVVAKTYANPAPQIYAEPFLAKQYVQQAAQSYQNSLIHHSSPIVAPQAHNVAVAPQIHNVATAPQIHNIQLAQPVHNVQVAPQNYNVEVSSQAHNIDVTPQLAAYQYPQEDVKVAYQYPQEVEKVATYAQPSIQVASGYGAAPVFSKPSDVRYEIHGATGNLEDSNFDDKAIYLQRSNGQGEWYGQNAVGGPYKVINDYQQASYNYAH